MFLASIQITKLGTKFKDTVRAQIQSTSDKFNTKK